MVEQMTPVKARHSISLKLQIAGRPGGMSAGDFIAMRYLLTAVLCLLGIGVGTLLRNPLDLAIFAAIGAVVGLYGPIFWLRGQVRKRRSDIQADLPDGIDVLVVCVEAGLTFEAAVRKGVEKDEPALAEESGRGMQEVRRGRAATHRLNWMWRA